MKRRLGAVALAISLIGAAGVANATTSSDVLGPSQKVGKCHLLGNGSYIYIEPSASSYVTAGHRTRNPGDVFPSFWFQQSKKSGEVFVEGTDDEVLLEWVDQRCAGGSLPTTPPEKDPDDVSGPVVGG